MNIGIVNHIGRAAGHAAAQMTGGQCPVDQVPALLLVEDQPRLSRAIRAGYVREIISHSVLLHLDRGASAVIRWASEGFRPNPPLTHLTPLRAATPTSILRDTGDMAMAARAQVAYAGGYRMPSHVRVARAVEKAL